MRLSFIAAAFLCGLCFVRLPAACAQEISGALVVFEEQDGRERVRIHSGNTGLPRHEVQVLRGDNPRIVVDIFDLSEAPDTGLEPGNGGYVSQVRSSYSPREKRLRVVLDLNTSAEELFITNSYDMTGRYRPLVIDMQALANIVGEGTIR